jgi:cation transport ATPase
MTKLAAGIFVAYAALVAVVSLQDPLGSIKLTPDQRSAGFQVVDIELHGEDCRFCRINVRIQVEQALKGLAGVQAAKVDKAHYRARVIYDPTLVQKEDLVVAVRETGFGTPNPSASSNAPAAAADSLKAIAESALHAPR